jgi:sulfur carrier protein ThiS
MKIAIKLMGMLKDRAPADGVLDVPDGATIWQVLAQLEIDATTVDVFTVNGKLERDKQRVLAANDELNVLPPVGGG